MTSSKVLKRMWRKFRMEGEPLRLFAKRVGGAYRYQPALIWLGLKMMERRSGGGAVRES